MKILFIHVCLAAVIITVLSCDTADNFYDTLNTIPELDISEAYSYRSNYTIGDSMHLYGRLNPDNGLTIEIGGAAVPVVRTTNRQYVVAGGNKKTMDRVSLIITPAIGAGSEKPVKISSGGYTIFGSPIDVFALGGTLSDTVKLALHYNLLFRSVFFHFYDGKGTIYLYGNKKCERLDKTATPVTVFSGEHLQDAAGAFSITTMLGGGVDPKEENIYFSAVTVEDSGLNSDQTIYRICRFSMATKQLTTLNRTLIPKDAKAVTREHYLPFEGSAATARIPGATGIYADNAGNVFLRLNNNYALCVLQADGTVRYLYKTLAYTIARPAYWNTTTNKAATMTADDLPGLDMTESLASIRVSIAEKLLYTLEDQKIRVYDIDSSLPLYALLRTEELNAAPVVVGDFAALTGYPRAGTDEEYFFWGYLPMPGERMVQLNYQRTVYTGMPALTMLNFNKRRADYYAPGALVLGLFQLNLTDQILNYDEDGHLYMTANDQARVVRTVYK